MEQQRLGIPVPDEREIELIPGCVGLRQNKEPSRTAPRLIHKRKWSVVSDTAASASSGDASDASDDSDDTYHSAVDDSYLFGKSLTPMSALRRYEEKVVNLNREELMSYKKIYFVGGETTAQKSTDDRRGPCKYLPHSHVAYRYEILDCLGKGGYGRVYRVFDHKEQRLVALKMIRRRPSHQYIAASYELEILKYTQRSDVDNTGNVVRFYENFIFRNSDCMTFELLSISLAEYIKRNEREGCDLETVKNFSRSILRGLSFLGQNAIAHGDLKPGNIMLVRPDGHDVKIIDFGMSFYSHTGSLFSNFGTMFYRAPEILFRAYCGLPIDMWSFGCIVAELFTGKRLFDGEDDFEQFAGFVEVLGMLQDNLFSQCSRYSTFVNDNGCPRYLSIQVCSAVGDPVASTIRGPPKSKPLSSLLEGSKCPQFIDFVSKCVDYHPIRRIRALKAIDHAWITGTAELSTEKILQNGGN